MPSNTDDDPRHWEEPPHGTDPRPDAPSEDFSSEDMMRMMTRMMNRRSTFDTVRCHKEIIKYRSARQESQMYTLKFSLAGIVPEIWRRVRVPAKLSLRDLHKKVFVPAMGWAPDAHGYVFSFKPFETNPGRGENRMGFAYGPARGEFIDMMHQGVHGLDIADSSEGQVRDLFSGGRTEAIYIYDLGDFFLHTIYLESVEDVSEASEGAFMPSVLGGARACPPEDCGSRNAYAELLDDMDLVGTRACFEAFAKCNHACNYPRHDFHPDKFNLEAANQQVAKLFRDMRKPSKKVSPEDSTCSCALCRRRAGFGVPSSSLGSDILGYSVPIMSSSGGELDPSHRWQSNLTRGVTWYDGRKDGLACCALCLDRECRFSEAFERCGQCRSRFYCSRECQKAHWKSRHKEECPRLAKKAQENQDLRKESGKVSSEDLNCTCALCRRRAGFGVPSIRTVLGTDVPKMPSDGAELDPSHRQYCNFTRGVTWYEGRQDGLACCGYCFDRECRFSEAFDRCGRCKSKFYCSRECQKADWKFKHEEECPKMAKRAEEDKDQNVKATNVKA